MTTLAQNQSGFDASKLFTAKVSWPDLWQSVVESMVAFAGRLAYALVLLVVGWLLINWIVLPIVRRLLHRKKYEVTTVSFIELSIGTLLKIMLVISVIDLLGIEVLSISALLAAFGLGVGSSISGLIQNFFAGLILVAQQPIRVGNWIEVFNNISGEVLVIGVTHTQLLSGSKQSITVPNSLLTQQPVINYNAKDTMRVEILFWVRHTEDVQLIREMFLEVCACNVRVLAAPKPALRAGGVDLDGVKLSFFFWCHHFERWDAEGEIVESLKSQFERFGVQFQIRRQEIELTPPAPEIFDAISAALAARGKSAAVVDSSANPAEEAAKALLDGGARVLSGFGSPTRGGIASSGNIIASPARGLSGMASPSGGVDQLERAYDYRTARPQAEDRARLAKLIERWDDFLDDIHEAEQKAAAAPSQVFRRPLKRLRHKFRLYQATPSASESSEDEQKKVERVMNFSKTALQTDAAAHVREHELSRWKRQSKQAKRRTTKQVASKVVVVDGGAAHAPVAATGPVAVGAASKTEKQQMPLVSIDAPVQSGSMPADSIVIAASVATADMRPKDVAVALLGKSTDGDADNDNDVARQPPLEKFDSARSNRGAVAAQNLDLADDSTIESQI